MNNKATTWYEVGIHKLLQKCDKCLNVKVDYVYQNLYIKFPYYYLRISWYGETLILWTAFVKNEFYSVLRNKWQYGPIADDTSAICEWMVGEFHSTLRIQFITSSTCRSIIEGTTFLRPR